jgi:Flp pilus assembly protein CpaB
MTYRLRNIGIALVLALVAGLLTVFYVTNYKRDVRNAESDVTIYVAAADIPAGTSGAEMVAKNMLAEQEVAKRSVTPGAISSPEQVADKVSSGPIYVGEQITTRRFTTQEARGIRAELTGTTRAVQIPGSEHQLLAGTLKDGDHVDIVGSWNVPEGITKHYSRVVLRDILVVKASGERSSSEKLTNPNQGALYVILALTDAQAQKLFWITKNGDWTLQLRPTEDAADSPPGVETAETLLRDGFGATNPGFERGN